MGSAIQKILQGRGDKEGQGFWIKKAIPLLCLVLTWAGLLKDFPATMPVLWFSFSTATSIANAKLHAEIEKLATKDGITGLFNHRVFQEKLSEELKKLSRYSEPSSLLLADIDFFKKINDTYGHPSGDLVLKEVSRIIIETIRDMDIPARYGREEFAAILPRTDSQGAMIIAERVRMAVMNASFDIGIISPIRPIQVKLSIGIATTPSDAKTKEELIEKADQALYYAKHNGRNQSAQWSEIKN